MRRALATIVLMLVATAPARGDDRPDVVFILLDTTRADRLSTYAGPNPTTPNLDALAAGGLVFERHFANAHATRPSMPQLMSGRYYHQNILGEFRPDSDPREYRFSRSAPEGPLLPTLLRRHGYVASGVSAHAWVVPESPFGRAFDAFELLPFPAEAGHADGKDVVDRAIALWQARDRSRPLLLYLHLMDMHLPRPLPPGGVRFAAADAPARHRFRTNGEPDFDHERRRWDRTDARDFSADDRAWFTAVYDTRLAYADGELARLFAALRADDPQLAHTTIVITADHGEELGEDGRTDHTDSLADGVQHIPWIMAGAGVPRGVRTARFTEHVDVLPTLLAAVGLSPPADVPLDGRARLTTAGQLAATPSREHVVFAFEDYRAIRTDALLVREHESGLYARRCQGGGRIAYQLATPHRAPIDPSTSAVTRLARVLDARLAQRARRFRATRWEAPASAFTVRHEHWRPGEFDGVACATLDPTAGRPAFRDGWTATPRGLVRGPAGEPAPLALSLAVPPGTYGLEVVMVPFERRPWFWGIDRWLRRSFLRDGSLDRIGLGSSTTGSGTLDVTLPASIPPGRIVSIRLTPPGASTGNDGGAKGPDAQQRERLRALGYVE